MQDTSIGVTIKFLEKEIIENLANEFRNKFTSNSIPVDVELLAEKEGLQLTPIPGLKKAAGTEAFLTRDLSEIVFEPNSPDVRIYFSIAHELGHYILHSEQIKLLAPQSFVDWMQMVTNLPGPIWGRAEKQANLFAEYLLIPTSNLKSEIITLKDQIVEAKNIIGIDIEALNEYLANPLAKKFCVSAKTMLIRLTNSGINPYDVIKNPK